MKKYPSYQQLDEMDCGPTCLRMIAKYHGRVYSSQFLREKSFVSREGVSFLGISEAAEQIGFRSLGVKLSYSQLAEEAPLPCIAHWNQDHFVVIYAIHKNKIKIGDPAIGSVLTYSKDEFLKSWLSIQENEEEQGVVMLLEPSPSFYEREEEDKSKRQSVPFLLKYLKPHTSFIIQLTLGLLLGSILQLIFPFLTQSIVDVGINTRNLNFIYIVLAAQLMLFFSRTMVEMIRRWILLHLSTRVNISLISDFLIKLMALPIAFFDSKKTGDLIQRISDHQRIQSFLSTSTLNILFSFFNLIIFGAVLAYYNRWIFSVFIIGSVLYFTWIFVFLKKRRELDHKRFQQLSGNQSNLIQLIMGMQEIKLNHCENPKRWEWERIQAKIFRINVNSVALEQYQQEVCLSMKEPTSSLHFWLLRQ